MRLVLVGEACLQKQHMGWWSKSTGLGGRWFLHSVLPCHLLAGLPPDVLLQWWKSVFPRLRHKANPCIVGPLWELCAIHKLLLSLSWSLVHGVIINAIPTKSWNLWRYSLSTTFLVGELQAEFYSQEHGLLIPAHLSIFESWFCYLIAFFHFISLGLISFMRLKKKPKHWHGKIVVTNHNKMELLLCGRWAFCSLYPMVGSS